MRSHPLSAAYAVLLWALCVVGCAAPGSDAAQDEAALTGPTLKAIALTPATATIFDGGVAALTVTGFYADATTRDLTSVATYVSNNPAAATVSADGHVTGVLHGYATITAKVGSLRATAKITVSVSMTAVAIAPTPIAQPAGTTRQLAATASYDNGTTKKLTTGVTWTSNDPTVATVTSGGLLVTIAPGSTTLLATVTGSSAAPVVGVLPVTVTGATMTAVAVTPAIQRLAKGQKLQLTATATFSDASKYVLVPPVVSWSAAAPAIASVGPTGIATAVAIGGPAAIHATPVGGGPVGSAAITVSAAALVSIAVTPKTPTVAAGLTVPFSAQATFTDGTVVDYTTQVTWSTSAAATATVAATGVAQGVAVGTATITATDPKTHKAGTATLAVTPAVLAAIALSPVAPSVPAGLSRQLDALGTWTDGTTQNLDATATWTSSAPAIATVVGGLVIGLVPGTATITATDPATGIAQSVAVTVTPGLLVSIAVTPVSPIVPLDTTAQLTATGTYTDGTTADITAATGWTSSSLTVAVANAPSAGLVTVLAPGDPAVVTATDPVTGISGATTVTAGPAILEALAITPAPVSLVAGQTAQLTATGTMSDASSVGYTSTVTWSSSSPTVRVTNQVGDGVAGLVVGVSAGDAVVTATDPLTGISTSVAVTVAISTNDDAAAQFSPFANPVGNWSYGWEASPGARFQLDPFHPAINVAYEYGTDGADYMYAVHNASAVQQRITGTGYLDAGELALAVPLVGLTSDVTACRWTAPTDGTFVVHAAFHGNPAYCYVGEYYTTGCLYNGCPSGGESYLPSGGSVTVTGTGFLSLGYDIFTCPSNASWCYYNYSLYGCGLFNSSTCVNMRMSATYAQYGCATPDSQASVGVLVDGAPVYAAEVLGTTPQAFTTSLFLHAGDTLDFEVGDDGVAHNYFDPIHFSATVQTCADAGLTDCGTSCVDLTSDLANCGACGATCGTADPNATAACTPTGCATTCNAGLTDCGTGCVDVQSDPNTCGACGLTCSSNHISAPACAAGACDGACDAGFDDCDGDRATNGCEADLGSDASNCGACGVVCPTTCTAGVCD